MQKFINKMEHAFSPAMVPVLTDDALYHLIADGIFRVGIGPVAGAVDAAKVLVVPANKV